VKKWSAFCFATALVVSVFGLAACEGGDEAQQQPNQQEEEKAAQPTPPTPAAQSGNRAASGLIGTWELTHMYGEPVDPGTGTQTFSEDGTHRSITTDFLDGNIDVTGHYKVLDDSRIQIAESDVESAPVQEYSLNGDTLTFYVDSPEGPLELTWRRTS
jgi:hypothetical protein